MVGWVIIIIGALVWRVIGITIAAAVVHLISVVDRITIIVHVDCDCCIKILIYSVLGRCCRDRRVDGSFVKVG